MNWDDVSDFEINKGVSILLDIHNGDMSFYERLPHLMPDYCNSWADVGTIISANGISLIKWCEPDEGYEASIVTYYGHGSVNSDIFYSHTNPLRAAAIVFLMMHGVKSEDLITEKS